MAGIHVKINLAPRSGLRRSKGGDKHNAFHPYTRQTTRQKNNIPQHCCKCAPTKRRPTSHSLHRWRRQVRLSRPHGAEAAEIQTANLLFNSTISTKRGQFMCIDLKDFYLGIPMNRYKYMWINMADIPQDIINQYGLTAKSSKWKDVSGNLERHVRPEASRSHCQRPTQTTPQSFWVCAMQIHSRDIYSHQPQDILRPLR